MKILGTKNANTDIVDKEYVDKSLEEVKQTIPKVWIGNETEYSRIINKNPETIYYIIE